MESDRLSVSSQGFRLVSYLKSGWAHFRKGNLGFKAEPGIGNTCQVSLLFCDEVMKKRGFIINQPDIKKQQMKIQGSVALLFKVLGLNIEGWNMTPISNFGNIFPRSGLFSCLLKVPYISLPKYNDQLQAPPPQCLHLPLTLASWFHWLVVPLFIHMLQASNSISGVEVSLMVFQLLLSAHWGTLTHLTASS